MKKLLLVTALAATLPVSAMAGESAQSDAEEIRALEGNIATILGEQGFEVYSDLFHPDYTNWGDTRAVMPRDAYMAAVRRWYEAGNHAIRTQLAPVSVEVFGDIGFSRYMLREDFNDGTSFVGRFASLVRRDGGRWKLYRSNYNTLYRGPTDELPVELAASIEEGASAAGTTGHSPVATSGGATYHASELPYPFSDAVEIGGVLYMSGDIGANDAGTGVVPGGIEPETRRIFARMEQRLAKHGLTYDDVFKCTVMLADMSEWPAFNAVYAEYFKKGRYPARSAFGTNGLALGARVELECWAAR